MIAAEAEVAALVGKVQYVIDVLNREGLLEDGGFTFPDGDTWFAAGTQQ